MADVVSMLWIRNWFTSIDYEWLGNRIIVHGHTPVPEISIQHHLENLDKIQTIDIDNGCCFKKDDLNQLCAFDMTNRAGILADTKTMLAATNRIFIPHRPPVRPRHNRHAV